jgi:T5SS/PEP-CTERM-associated repeat protein
MQKKPSSLGFYYFSFFRPICMSISNHLQDQVFVIGRRQVNALALMLTCIALPIGVAKAQTQPLYVTNGSSIVINTNAVFDKIFVGDSNSSSNSLAVSDGALVQNAGIYIGNSSNSSNNYVLVTGTNSTLSASATSTNWVGFQGSGNRLIIANGANFNGNTFISGSAQASINSILVTGANSSLVASNFIALSCVPPKRDGNPLNAGDAGSGTITIANGGTITLGVKTPPITKPSTTGLNGALFVGSAGTLNIGSYGRNDRAGRIISPSGNIFGASSGSTINFNQTDNFTLTLPINGSFQINQLGSGTTTLAETCFTGSGVGSPSIMVSSGTLLLQNFVKGGGRILVTNSGTLGGTGIIGSFTRIAGGGTLLPGTNGVGSLKIANDLTLDAGSTTSFVIKSTDKYSSLSVLPGAEFTPGGSLTMDLTAYAPTANDGDGFLLYNVCDTNDFTSVAAVGIPMTFSNTPVGWIGTNNGLYYHFRAGQLLVTSVSSGYPTLSDQTITFPRIPDRHYFTNEYVIPAATCSSGLPLAFVVRGPAVVDGSNNLSISGCGTVTVVASQSGGASYNAAPPVTNTFTVFGLNQTISFDAIPDQIAGGAPISLNATASSGLPLSFVVLSGPALVNSDNTLTITGIGQVTVAANQSGNNVYSAASVTKTFLALDPFSPDWKAPADRQYVTTIIAKVVDTNGVLVSTLGSKLAAFDTHGNVTGVATLSNSTSTFGFVVGSDTSHGGMTYQIYDEATQQQVPIVESLDFKALTPQGTIAHPLILHEARYQEIPIITGWNWISFNVFPPDGSVNSLLSSYTEAQDNDVIKGSTGSATYFQGVWYPSQNFTIQPGQMYELYSHTDTTLTASGLPPVTPVTSTLTLGWNWVGCPLLADESIETFLSGVTAVENDQILTQSEFESYSNGSWVNLGNSFRFQPGAGYLLYVGTPQTIRF